MAASARDLTPADLRARLARLGAVCCGMAHERVVPDAPPAAPFGEPTTRFVRPGLCPAARRRANLACTHSLARMALRDALQCLDAADPASGFAADLATLHARDAELGPLDHRRYEAETRLAQARIARDETGVSEARAAIVATEVAHEEATAALAALRLRALAGLDEILARSAAGGRVS